MADYRLSVKIIGRSSGQSALAAAAYRAGAQLHDERSGLDHDYTRKRGVLHSEILAPDDAPDWMKDRAKLWNAVEKIENRKDSQLAREIQLSLPHELTEDQNRELVLGFVQSRFVTRGMIADVAIHAPDRQGDQRNIHAHVMLTLRDLMGDGFGKKNRDWNTTEQLKEWRKNWAEYQNQALEELGMEQRVDHRSLADQGVDREPTQHLGAVANDMERRGKASRVGDENRARQQRNTNRAALAQEATKTTHALAEERARLDKLAAIQKTAQASLHHRDELEMSRRHTLQSANLDADLSQRNDDRRRQLEAERQHLAQQLEADGWRKLMRDLLGKTKQDREQLRTTRLNLESLRQREVEERQALQARQDAERQSREQSEQQRKDAYALKLEQDRTAALEATRAAEKPAEVRTPSNDRQNLSWTRTAAQEQDNGGLHGGEFQKAAVGASAPPQSRPAVDPAKAQAREKALERARAAFSNSQSRDGGRDYE